MKKIETPDEDKRQSVIPRNIFIAGGEIRNVQTGDSSNMTINDAIGVRPEIKLAAVIGVAFVVVLLLIAICIPNPTPFRYIVFRSILSLAAALIVVLVPGMLKLKASVFKNLAVRATSGFAVFFIMYAWNPAGLSDQSLGRLISAPRISTTPAKGQIAPVHPTQHIFVTLLGANPRITLDGEPNASREEIRIATEQRLANTLNSTYTVQPNHRGSGGVATISGVVVRGNEGYPEDIRIAGTLSQSQQQEVRIAFAGTRFPVPNDQDATGGHDKYTISVRIVER